MGDHTTTEVPPDFLFNPTPPPQTPTRAVLPWWGKPRQLVYDGKPEPAFWTRSDGATLAYAGRTNWASGPKKNGKSMAALMAMQEVIEGGGRVIYVDLENSAHDTAKRIYALGGEGLLWLCQPQQGRFRRIRQNPSHEPAALEWLREWTRQDRTALVVIDSVTSAGCPVANPDISEWVWQWISPLKPTRSAIFCIDHTPADGKAKPVGSFFKGALLDGCGLIIRGKPWKPAGQLPGQIQVTLDGDRPGEVPAIDGDCIATISGWWSGGVFCYAIEAPGQATKSATARRITTDILSQVAMHPAGIAGKTLRKTITGSYDAIGKALKQGETDGLWTTTTGASGGYHYHPTTPHPPIISPPYRNGQK